MATVEQIETPPQIPEGFRVVEPELTPPQIPEGFSVVGEEEPTEQISEISSVPEDSTINQLWGRVMGLFQDPQKQSAEAVQALVDSEAFGIPPSTALRLQGTINRGIEINPTAARKRSTLTERVAQSWDIGTKQNQVGELGYKFIVDGNPEWLKAMEDMKLPGPEEVFVTEGRLEDAVRSAAKLLPMTVDIAREAGWKGATVGTGFGMIALLAGQPELAPVMALAGLKIGGAEGLFEGALRKEAGLALSEIINLEDAEGNKIDPGIARAVSFGVGVINAGLEVAEVKILMNTIPGLNKLFSQAIMETVTSKTLKQQLVGLAGTYGKTVAKETGVEVAQESTNIVFTELGKQVNNVLKDTDIPAASAHQIMERLFETARESAQGFAVIAAPGVSVQAGAAIITKAERKATAVSKTKEVLTSFGIDEETAQVSAEKAVDKAEAIRESLALEAEVEVPEVPIEAELLSPEEDTALDLVVEGTAELETLTDKELKVEEELPIEEQVEVEEDKRIISDEIYVAAQDRIKEKLKGLKAGVDPTVLPDLIITGAYHVETGLRTFSKWSKKMVEEYGDKIKPQLKDIWKQANDYLKAQLPAAKVKGQVRRATGIKKISKVIREDKALAAAWKKAEQSARIAFREGNKEGVAVERARLKEIFGKAKERVAQTTEVGRLKKSIIKEVEAVKPKKRGGKPVGKYTAPVQKILDSFGAAMKLSQEQAADKISDNLDKYVGKQIPDSVVLENRVLDMVVRLRYRAGEPGAPPLRRRFTTGELKALLTSIKEMKAGGKAIAELKKLNRKARNQKLVDTAIDVIMGGEKLPEGLETTGARKVKPSAKEFKEWLKKFSSSAGIHFVGWNDLMDMLSARDKTSAPGQSELNKMATVHAQENAEKAGRTKAVQKIASIARIAFGFKSDREMLTQFNLDAKEMQIGKFRNAKGVTVDLVMTKAEARKFIMEYTDPALRETFHQGMNYTEDMVKAVRATLTAQDLAFIEGQLEFYREYYNRVNAVYRETYGVDLPFNEFYSPIRREGFAEPEGLYGAFLDEVSYRRSVGSGSLKSRVKNLKRISLQSDVNTLERHIAEMEHFIAWSDKVRELNVVFKNPGVRTAINLHHSPAMLGVIDKFINDFTRGGVETANRLTWLDRFRGNFTRSVLAIKPIMAVKQLTSVMAYMEVMPVTDFVKGVADFWTAPLERVKFLKKNSVWFAERGTYMERDVKTAMRMKEYSAYMKGRGFMDSLMLNVALGDQGAIAIGGWSYYKYLTTKKGLSQKDALIEFEKFSEMTQQSADLSMQSDIQRMGSIAKLFSMFLSAPNLYLRKEMGAVRNLLAGRGSRLKHAKTLVIYHVLLPSLFQLVADMFDWDEDNQKRAIIMGPLNGLFIIGEGIEHIISKALGVRAYSKEVAPYSAADDLGKFITEAIRLVAEGELTDEEFYRGVRGLAGAIGATTGLPLKQAVDQVKTGIDFIDGEYEKALKELVGYSPYAVEKQEEGKKKKGKSRL